MTVRGTCRMLDGRIVSIECEDLGLREPSAFYMTRFVFDGQEVHSAVPRAECEGAGGHHRRFEEDMLVLEACGVDPSYAIAFEPA